MMLRYSSSPCSHRRPGSLDPEVWPSGQIAHFVSALTCLHVRHSRPMDTEPRCSSRGQSSNPQSFNLVRSGCWHTAARVRLIDPRIRVVELSTTLAGAEKPAVVYSFAILAFDFHRLDKLA